MRCCFFVMAFSIMINQISLYAFDEGLLPSSSVLLEKTPAFVLQVPKDQQRIIEELISIMGSHSTIALGFKKSHLEGLGKEIRGIGPLQFLAYIFSEASLSKHMRSIKNSSFKWNGFMKGFIPTLKREYANQTLLKDLPGFAIFLAVPYQPLEKAANDQNWDEFVTLLIESKK